MTDIARFAESAIYKLNGKVKVLDALITGGGLEDWASYKRHCGKRDGLNEAITTITEAAEAYYRDEDEEPDDSLQPLADR